MNLNNVARGATPLTLRERWMAKACSAALAEFKRVPSLIDVDFNLNSNFNVGLDLNLTSKAKAKAKAESKAKAWKPFHSLLIDTVKVKLRVLHPPLQELALNNANVKQDGYKFLIKCPLTGARVQMFSKENGQVLLLEFSVPKFLTGQNIVGHLDLHAGSLAAIKKAFKLLGFLPSPEERAAIGRGDYALTRVDVTVHVDCGSSEHAQALMIALREYIVGNAGDVSLYGLETGYIGQGSKRRTFKWYRKGIELKKKGRAIPAHVYGSEYLTEVAQRLVRFELTLRGKELARLGLTSPMAWDEQVAKKQLFPWLFKLKQAEGVLPDTNGITGLSPVMQNKLRLWLLGDVLAFSRGVSKDAYRDARKKVKMATGLDIELARSPTQQAAAFTTIRQLFERGLGFKTYEEKWGLLVQSAHQGSA